MNGRGRLVWGGSRTVANPQILSLPLRNIGRIFWGGSGELVWVTGVPAYVYLDQAGNDSVLATAGQPEALATKLPRRGHTDLEGGPTRY